jgi:monoamine oxidase
MWPGSVSRRRFLNRLGAVGGYSAVYGAMQTMGLLAPARAWAAVPSLPPGSGAGRSVIVLGAGIAGLVSAYELRKAGYAVTVVEARDRVGGRAWSIRGGDTVRQIGRPDQHCAFDAGHYFNAGPARIPTHHHLVLGYAQALKVPLEVMVNVDRSARFDFGGTPVASRQGVNDQRGRIAELLAKAIDKGALDAELTGVDKAALRGWLRAFGSLRRDGSYQGSESSGYSELPGGYDHPGKLVEPLSLPQLQASGMFGAGPIFEEIFDQQAPMFQPVGGMDRIADALYRAVEPSVRLSSPVSALNWDAKGAAVKLASGEVLRADQCICTLPATYVRKLDAPFSPAKKAALARLAYGPGTKVAFEAPRFWQDDDVWGGLAWTKEASEIVWYPSGAWDDPRGVIVGDYSIGFTAQENADAFAAASFEQRFETCRRVIDRLHPGKAALLEKPLTVSWTQTEWSLGVGGDWAERGADYRELCRPEGPVAFAGEHLSYVPFWQEGAALSAHEALKLVDARRG